MTATATPLPATQLAYRNADKPLIIPKNRVEDCAGGYPRSRDVVPNFDQPDQSSALFPATNLNDNTRRTQWRHGTSQTDVHILVDFGQSIDVSALLIEGDDNTLANRTLDVLCSDSISMAGALNFTILNPIAVAPLVDGRNVFLLDSTYRARYWDLHFDDNGEGAVIYRLKQLWMGEQVQLPFHSRVPYDEDQGVSDFVDVRSRSGDITRIVYVPGLFRRDFSYWLRDAATAAALRQAYSDADGWGNKIWHIEYPNSGPKESALFGNVEKSGLNLPSQLEDDRLWKNAVLESGPHLD